MSQPIVPTGPQPRMSPPGTAPKNQETKKKASKLGTFSGVFVPTSLNIFSILMFLRFGFIIGQTGVLGFLGKFRSTAA
jgi:potassium/chloride transporter 9